MHLQKGLKASQHHIRGHYVDEEIIQHFHDTSYMFTFTYSIRLGCIRVAQRKLWCNGKVDDKFSSLDEATYRQNFNTYI